MAYMQNADLMRNDQILMLFTLLLFAVLFSCSEHHLSLFPDSVILVPSSNFTDVVVARGYEFKCH